MVKNNRRKKASQWEQVFRELLHGEKKIAEHDMY